METAESRRKESCAVLKINSGYITSLYQGKNEKYTPVLRKLFRSNFPCVNISPQDI